MMKRKFWIVESKTKKDLEHDRESEIVKVHKET